MSEEKHKDTVEFLAQYDTCGTRGLLRDVALMKCREALQAVLDVSDEPFGFDGITKDKVKEALKFSRWVID